MSTTPPGWYHDPWRQAPMRWWDGVRWTEHLADWHGIRPAPPRVYAGPSIADRLDAEQRLTPWLRRLLWLWPLGAAASAAFLGATVEQFVDAIDEGRALGPISGWWYLTQLAGLLSLALVIVRIVWLYRAAQTARDLGLAARRDPLPAAIGWIVPIINLWWPYQGVTDLFPAHQRPDRRIAWWWTCSIVGSILPLAAIAGPFVPVGVAVGIVAVAVAPIVVAAVLELGLVRDAIAIHRDMAGPS
jgi:hypothetical protein